MNSLAAFEMKGESQKATASTQKLLLSNYGTFKHTGDTFLWNLFTTCAPVMLNGFLQHR